MNRVLGRNKFRNGCRLSEPIEHNSAELTEPKPPKKKEKKEVEWTLRVRFPLQTVL